MAYDARFGPTAQTPAQRAWVLEQMQAVVTDLKNKATTANQQLYARYVAGEISWAEMRQALEASQLDPNREIWVPSGELPLSAVADLIV